VKFRAVERGLTVHQPTKVRDGALERWIREREVDVALVVAYGRILPLGVLTAPRVGCVNVHASLLPKFRGAAPINWCIVRGERETGVGLMRMEEGLDTGPVFASVKTPIGADETAGELSERLSHLAATLVRERLAEVVAGKLTAVPQDDAAATLAPIMKKEDGRLDWSLPAAALHDHVRGMQPWPGAYTSIAGKSLRVLRTSPLASVVHAPADVARVAGRVLIADKHAVVVACGPDARDAIEIHAAQLEGKRAMPASDLVNGRALAVGMLLGG
jgi:methionyl-tRNA formyltransferase